MNRRRFLRDLAMGLVGAASAEAIDRLLWVPKPMIVVPAMPPVGEGRQMRLIPPGAMPEQADGVLITEVISVEEYRSQFDVDAFDFRLSEDARNRIAQQLADEIDRRAFELYSQQWSQSTLKVGDVITFDARHVVVDRPTLQRTRIGLG